MGVAPDNQLCHKSGIGQGERQQQVDQQEGGAAEQRQRLEADQSARRALGAYLPVAARRKKARFAGRSAILRVRYGYHASPNGT